MKTDERWLSEAIKRHGETISEARADLRYLHDTAWRLAETAGPDLPWSDWVALSALVLEMRPALILELGRGIGSSTSLFQYWSARTGSRVVSICNTDLWTARTLPVLRTAMQAIDWDGVEALHGDILEQNYPVMIEGAPSVLLFWDAHGRQIADVVMSQIIPALPADNIVIAHDMRDTRYFPNPEPDVAWTFAGTMFSPFAQIGPIADYCASRSRQLCSASHAIHSDGAVDVARRIDSDGVCYWHYFNATPPGNE